MTAPASAAPAHGSSEPGQGGPILSIRDLSITFSGLRALDGVSFDVPTGGVTAVIGPNGAGKTTLFNCISGIYRGEGRIELSGESLEGTSPHARAALGIARTFQTPTLIEDDTVLANVMLGGFPHTRAGLLSHMVLSRRSRREENERRELSAEALDLMGLLPLAGARAADLPHGLRRRVELARALVAQPRLVLLDEPAAGISHTEALEFADLLTGLAERSGATLLLVEHSVALVMRVARRIAVLDFGKLVVEGEPSLVRQDPRVLAAYLGDEADS
jgi:branched-chain amino acid transport system ATP-binding protein